jgi:hypothetical protein
MLGHHKGFQSSAQCKYTLGSCASYFPMHLHFLILKIIINCDKSSGPCVKHTWLS